jgi:hypothetical protein
VVAELAATVDIENDARASAEPGGGGLGEASASISVRMWSAEDPGAPRRGRCRDGLGFADLQLGQVARPEFVDAFRAELSIDLVLGVGHLSPQQMFGLRCLMSMERLSESTVPKAVVQ